MATGKKMKQKLFKQSLRPPKQYQKRGNKLISSDLSSKILKEALEQQKEEILLREATEGGGAFIDSFDAAVSIDDGEEEDIDGFQGFSETDESQYHAGAEQQDIDEEDERILEVFMSKEAAGPQQLTLADLIIQKIKDTTEAANTEVQQLPQLDSTIIDLYKGVGKLLSRYTEGKTPKAFKHIPSLELWEEVLYLTEPENWSPNAMYQATRIFSSKRVEKAQRFYNLVLLPRIRDDIRKHNKLHFSLYQSLKKSLYKPAAFFKGILLPLCQSGTCTLREAVIIGSIIQKYSIPSRLSSAAMIEMAEMEYCGTTSYFIKLFLDKKYALHLQALDAAVAHFMKFLDDSRIMPVIWHHSLLALVQSYKNGLTKEVKDNLDRLIQYQKHHLVTPEIRRELKNSRNRGENEEDLMSIYILDLDIVGGSSFDTSLRRGASSHVVSVIMNRPIEEDQWDVPPVPMEEEN